MSEDSPSPAQSTGARVFPEHERAERNATLEVDVYAPGWLAVADDGGPRVVLLSPEGEAVWVDVGCMDPGQGDPLGMSFDDWVAAGAPIPEEPNTPWAVDIVLEHWPIGGLRSLYEIKKVLGLQLPPASLKALQQQVPVTLKREHYGVALKLLEQIGLPCLSIREDT